MSPGNTRGASTARPAQDQSRTKAKHRAGRVGRGAPGKGSVELLGRFGNVEVGLGKGVSLCVEVRDGVLKSPASLAGNLVKER